MIVDKFSLLKVVEDKVNCCQRCEIHKTKLNYVFARGNPNASVMICAEAPGQEEDDSGLPLVGLSGKLLNKTLVELNINIDEDIYVFNTTKCRPPKNRKPTDDELNNCSEYFEEQIKIVNPKVIIALGNTAVNNLINTTYGITKIHGQFFKRGNAFIMPVFHPSYVLRNGSSGPIFDAFKADLKSAFDKSKVL